MAWNIVLGVLAAGLTAVAIKTIAERWNKAQAELKGKKIAVLGPRASGKTTLIRFLLKDEISEEYIQTAKPEKFSGKTLKLKELELRIEDTVDVPGDIQSHEDWERLYKSADFAFYLVDASRFHAADSAYMDATVRDMRHIAEWFDECKDNPPKFFLVATHCDLIPDYASLAEANKAEFTDALWKTQAMHNLILFGRGTKNVKCVAGSLNNRKSCEQIVSDILRQAIA